MGEHSVGGGQTLPVTVEFAGCNDLPHPRLQAGEHGPLRQSRGAAWRADHELASCPLYSWLLLPACDRK